MGLGALGVPKHELFFRKNLPRREANVGDEKLQELMELLQAIPWSKAGI